MSGITGYKSHVPTEFNICGFLVTQTDPISISKIYSFFFHLRLSLECGA